MKLSMDRVRGIDNSPYRKVIEKFGVLDGTINAARVLPICDSLSIDYGHFKTCLDVN
jgi:hypothetical protein